jgi:hypothetical protein
VECGGGEQRGGHDGQRGVFRAMRLDGAFEREAAADAESCFEPIEHVHEMEG